MTEVFRKSAVLTQLGHVGALVLPSWMSRHVRLLAESSTLLEFRIRATAGQGPYMIHRFFVGLYVRILMSGRSPQSLEAEMANAYGRVAERLERLDLPPETRENIDFGYYTMLTCGKNAIRASTLDPQRALSSKMLWQMSSSGADLERYTLAALHALESPETCKPRVLSELAQRSADAGHEAVKVWAAFEF